MMRVSDAYTLCTACHAWLCHPWVRLAVSLAGCSHRYVCTSTWACTPEQRVSASRCLAWCVQQNPWWDAVHFKMSRRSSRRAWKPMVVRNKMLLNDLDRVKGQSWWLSAAASRWADTSAGKGEGKLGLGLVVLLLPTISVRCGSALAEGDAKQLMFLLPSRDRGQEEKPSPGSPLKVPKPPLKHDLPAGLLYPLAA